MKTKKPTSYWMAKLLALKVEIELEQKTRDARMSAKERLRRL